jgi:SAM-dependent methyltransferase
MENFDRKKHWENIYCTKEQKEVSWYQETPVTSLNLIEESGISRTAKIIDVGGGDSFLVDALLELGFTDITVVDISEAALKKAQQRLGEKSKGVKWIVADAADFSPPEKYDLWHDRAAFHFLTSEQEVSGYKDTVGKHLNEGGHLIIGTFSEQGPKKCSGIEIRQYSKEKLHHLFSEGFVKEKCITVDHSTPFNTAQNFLFCRFRRNNEVKSLS